MTNLQIAQDFAIGQCLSDYPPDLTYQEILDLYNDDERDDDDAPLVTVWEPFEYLDIENIINNMVSAVERLLNSIQEQKTA